MRKTLLTVLVLLLLASPAAHAQAIRTWVSGVGDDANPGSRTAPCKTFAGVIAKTAAGGEISVIDPGGFGTFTIGKSLTVDGGGLLAGVSTSAAGANGITVAAADTDTIILRRLSLQGFGTAGTAIRITGARRVVIEECFVSGWETGIAVETTTTCEVIVRDSYLRGGTTGVSVNMTGAGSRATLDRCQVTGATNAVSLVAGILDVNGCLVSQNTGVALLAQGGVLNSFSNLLAANGQDVQFSGGGSVRTFNNLGPVSMSLRQDTTVTNVAPGSPAVFHLTLTPPPGGFPADVAFSTVGLPPGLVCTFDPATVPAGSGATPVTMTVAEASGRQALGFLPWLALGLLAAAGGALAGSLLGAPGRRLATCLPMLLLAVALAVPGCGGGSSGGGGGTASSTGVRAPLSGTFPFTVTATSGGTSVSQQFTASFR